MWKQYLIGALISLGAGYLFFRMVDFSAMAQAMSEMQPIYLLSATAVYLISFVARAIRWHYLMRPIRRVKILPLFAALMVGFLGNNLLPAHLGEVVRAYVLGRSEGVSKSATFATIVLERVYDGLTVLFLLLMVLIFMDLPEGDVAGSAISVSTLRQAGWAGLGLFAGLMLALQAFRWQRKRMLSLCAFCLRPLPRKLGDRLLGILDAFTDGLAVAKASDLLNVAFWSLITWLGLAAWAWSLFPAFGLDLGFMAGVLMEVVVALALLIPAAPAFIGTFHLAAAATLGFVGASAGVAGSYAMMLWVTHFVSTTLVGLYFLWRQGLGLSALSGKDK